MNDPPVIKCGKQYAVRIDDEPYENLLIWFDPLYRVISGALRSGKKVLIHCMAGVSRSATVTAAFLMRKFKYSRDRAILEIEKYRPFINPNKGFMIQLKTYERYVRLGTAVNGGKF
jgi:protein-tyrosine phosphatase